MRGFLSFMICLLLGSSVAFADVGTVTPAGTTAATAAAMTAQDVYVSSASVGAGVILSAKGSGLTQSITNATSGHINVYPQSGASINGVGTDTAVPLAANSRMNCEAYNSLVQLCTVSGLVTSTNVGAVTTAATEVATEYGDKARHMTKIAMTSFAIGTSGDNAALALGAKFYTWPASTNIEVTGATLAGGVTCAISITTDTPEVSIGSVIASGANATMTTATWENIMDGGATNTVKVDGASVLPDVAGTAFYKNNLSTTRPIIKSSGGAARDLFLNIAATWSDVAAAGACTFTGNVWLEWRVL